MKSIWYGSLLLVVSAAFAQDISSNSPIIGSTETQSVSENTLSEEQQKGMTTLLGSVIDQSSREPLANAMVSLIGTKYSATTSADGQYRIESIPEGIYQIKAEADGYETQIMNNIVLDDEKKKENKFFTLQKKQSEPADFIPVEVQPQIIPGNNPPPVYPEIARRAGVEGIVWLKLWINEQGAIRKAVVLKSDAEVFNQPSIDAAMKWKFTPAILKGKPTAVWVSIPFKFKEFFAAEELIKLPKPIKTQNPKYPESARKNNLEGEFWVNVSIDEKGDVIGAYIHRLHVVDNKTIDDTLSEELKAKLSGRAYASVNEMSDEAVKAVRRWKFSPGIKDKNAVKTRLIVPIKFSLNTQKKK